MEFEPRRTGHTPEIMAALCMITSLVMYGYVGAVVTVGGVSRGMLQLIAVAIGAIGIYLLIRWSLTTFRYELHDGNFVVVKRVGKKEVMVCDLSMKLAIDIYPKSEMKTMTERYGPATKYHNYVVRFLSEESYILRFRDADTHACIVLEPSAEFLAELVALNARNSGV